MTVDGARIPGKSSLDSFYLTDGNWNKGVARRWAGFIVPNTYYYLTNFQIGKDIRLVNGEVRKILEVAEALGGYLNVYVDGPIMDPLRVGTPDHFVILEMYGYKYNENSYFLK